MEAGYRVVARFSKPHGLKGEAIVHVLAEQPERVFVPGCVVVPLHRDGRPAGPALTIERARAYHRRWLLKFREIDARTPLEEWRAVELAVSARALPASQAGRLTTEEIAGAVVTVDGRRIGTARALIPVPGGELLAVDRDGREVLIPFRAPIVERVDRERREICIAPPPGLLEL
jgi:16S rRNA processing protein RimM